MCCPGHEHTRQVELVETPRDAQGIQGFPGRSKGEAVLIFVVVETRVAKMVPREEKSLLAGMPGSK